MIRWALSLSGLSKGKNNTKQNKKTKLSLTVLTEEQTDTMSTEEPWVWWREPEEEEEGWLL